MTVQLELFAGYQRTTVPPQPAAPPGVLNVLHDVAGRDAAGSDPVGVPELGMHRPSLRRALASGLLARVDTGDPNTDGGRYRLQLTAEGRRALDADDAHRDANNMPRGNRAQIGGAA